MGFSEATPIQAAAIPPILQGRDIIGRARTGTGKTAAFAFPAVELTDGENKQDIQALILCPTRELALQTWGELKKIYKYKSGVKAAVLYGGQFVERQIRELKKGANIVVGTPGRVLDHLRRRTLRLQGLRFLVLDEADEMLSMGFREEMEAILHETPAQRQIVCFCATMPPQILELTKTWLKDPVTVEAAEETTDGGEIVQYAATDIAPDAKPAALREVLERFHPGRCIVFCNMQRTVDALCRRLAHDGIAAEALHGAMRQEQRTLAMGRFKNGEAGLLVATDVAARGIDARGVELVVNYDLPLSAEEYIHRIGRTGRAGAAGNAFTLCGGAEEAARLRAYARAAGAKLFPQTLAAANGTQPGEEPRKAPVQPHRGSNRPAGRNPAAKRVRRPPRGDKRRPDGQTV